MEVERKDPAGASGIKEVKRQDPAGAPGIMEVERKDPASGLQEVGEGLNCDFYRLS